MRVDLKLCSSTYNEYYINEDLVDYCKPVEGFEKLMVFLRHGKVVWAHKECVLQTEKTSKKNLTKKKKVV